MTKRAVLIVVSILFLIILGALLVFQYRRRKTQALGRVFEIDREETITIEDEKINMIYTPFFEPYNSKGKTQFSQIADEKKGLYLIRKSGSDQVLYVGHSLSNLYKTIYRHFQSWEWRDPQQYRVTYPKSGYEVALIILKDDSKIQDLEKYLIYKLDPPDNAQKYEYYEKQNEDIEEQNPEEVYVPEEVYEEPPF
ncbi:MAG: transmembrane domain-containing protein [Raineya sp.]|jgi:hypothetical protein|nr:transmembrane domain-containing protein [Raineya sp.]